MLGVVTADFAATAGNILAAYLKMRRGLEMASFVFKKHLTIGEAAAEDDSKFLQECFIETGDLGSLRDTESNKCIVLGRTGAGKSALLLQLMAVEKNIIQINPVDLSLNYLSNSTIINFLEGLGVKLDIFYQLLWKHIFTVELLRKKYSIDSEQTSRGFWERIYALTSKDKNKQKAIEYIRKWGDKFWLETDERVKEVTKNVEAQIEAGIGVQDLSVKAVEGMSEQTKTEILTRAQAVVNSIQIKELSNIVSLLAEDIFDDPQNRFYLVIDRLDEDWVEDKTRYKIISALLDTIKSFRKIRAVKIVVALRVDLLERTIQKNKSPGFQEEKYENMFLRVRWTQEQLESILDSRINYLIRDKYTKANVHFSDIFRDEIDNKKPMLYIASRTLMRPRDAIVFVNECLECAQDKPEITRAIIADAEKHYSEKRVTSLANEWVADYPRLRDYLSLLVRQSTHFSIGDITNELFEEFVTTFLADESYPDDPVHKILKEYFDGNKSQSSVLNIFFRILYRIGAVGIKANSFTEASWAHLNFKEITVGEVKSGSIIYIHPMLWKFLGSLDDERKIRRITRRKRRGRS